ncbi:hypothetical protein [Aliarcobacter cryaerophilus]|jgi:hypothetical protein|uniref:hypothetical protein n=1 Tax=Aliarcobacter cryaerophilus TaxID=28198 RepID=UPI0021B23554|nr:hypothetical protein [Aliarcobacter cryaerophilus]MCT7526267.1 hypothetical protein [Aliarcobacter cryaerophilus]
MKKLLILLIASSLSLFATINGKDENVYIKAIQAASNIPYKVLYNLALTDLYVEPNKTTPKGGKEIVYEYTLNSTQSHNYKEWKEAFEEELVKNCKGIEFLFGDKLNNAVVNKYKHLGKIVFQIKLDASMCR